MSTLVRPAGRGRSPGTAEKHSRRPSPVLAVPLVLIGCGAVSVSLLGPLVLGVIDYHVSGGASAQVRGGDVAGLLLVAPVCLVAAGLTLRGSPGADALALAPASYGLYMYTQLAIAGDLARYPGNSERWFGLFWALIVLCGVVLALAGRRVLVAAEPAARPRLERVTAWYLLTAAAFLVAGLHLPGLVDAWHEAPASTEYLADPGVFWLVKVMDLGYVVPVLVATGFGVLRELPWARRLLAPAVGWSALLASSVSGMGISMVATGSPGASLGLAAGFTLVAVVALGLATAAYRSWLRPGRAGHAPS